MGSELINAAKMKSIFFQLIVILFSSCFYTDQERIGSNHQAMTQSFINEEGSTIKTRIKPPENFMRIEVEKNSFAKYLRILNLKPHGSKVHLYNGNLKNTQNVHVAVVDMKVGNRDLQQCADAIIRFKAEYQYSQKLFEKIHFNFTNGFRADYLKWMKGYRIKVNGNNVIWVKTAEPSNVYEDFRKYLDLVFAYAGSLSLSKEMKKVDLKEMQIGDVLIQGGSPGHAVIVVDMALKLDTGEKLFLLAQSYMPAQEIHILKNPEEPGISPWYRLNQDDQINTPEWRFNKEDLKRFE